MRVFLLPPLLVLLTLLLRSPHALGASNFHLRNHTGLLFLYAFDEAQTLSSSPTYVRDRTGRGLMGNLTTSQATVSWSQERQGMRIPSISGGVRAESERSSASLLSLLSSDFTIEMFFSSPNNVGSTNLLIAGFGNWPPGAPFAPCDTNNTVMEGGWRIYSSLGPNLVFDGIFSVDGVPTCRSLSTAITLNTLRHLIVRVRDGSLAFSVHGSTQVDPSSDLSFNSALWARHTAPLTLANPHPTTGWTGSVYMIAMYDRFLSGTEIAANRDIGPPNSVPVIASPTLSIPEDETTTLYP